MEQQERIKAELDEELRKKKAKEDTQEANFKHQIRRLMIG